MTILPETAMQDIERVMARIGTLGVVKGIYPTVKCVIRAVEDLDRRLDNRAMLTMLYMRNRDNPSLFAALPHSIHELVRHYVMGEIKEVHELRERIKDALIGYDVAFREMVSPRF